ncbi:MAG: hypothetical protein JO171_18370, partial [Paludibacterium sp.]|uniref:hypothetical protein n=1 Tax=Paludibacterium sp. TaxID=1917523 RepID=UPI0025FD4A4F
MAAKIDQDFYPLQGGLDLMTPALMIDPGKCFDAQNYEPEITGGYRRIDGYERFDGRPSPSSANYWLLGIAQTGAISTGDTLTGVSSGATCRVLLLVGAVAVIGRLVGVFTVGESLTDAAVPVATVVSAAQIAAAPQPDDDATYALLAANDLRADIGPVPGSGPTRGAKLYKGTVYGFRDSADGLHGLMYKSSAAGWVLVPFGYEIGLTTLNHSATVTVTSATPGVVTWNGHNMANGQPVTLSTTGTMPGGLAPNFTYYLVGATANTFQLAASKGGAPLATSSSGTGTITCSASGGNINALDTIIGVTSGATATVAASLLRTGSWTQNLVGNLVVASTSGTFNASEILTVSGIMVANTITSAVAITRAPGGQMEFCNINFTGSATGLKMYGVDGVNPAFEWDGTTYVPIHTGATPDTPSHVINFKEALWLSILGNVEVSTLGQPYNWDALQGAGTFAVGDIISGFAPNGGTYVTGSTMSIFSDRHLYTMYGSSTADYKLVTSIWDMGFSAFTMQPVSNDTYGWTSRGIQTIITTLTFGDFDYNSISHEIQSLINKKQGLQIASTSLHQKNQYRVYFSDGTALTVGLTGDKMNGIMPLNYNLPVRCISTDTNAAGAEVTYFGSDNG